MFVTDTVKKTLKMFIGPFENDQSLTVKAEFEIFAEAYLTFLNLYKTVAST